MCIQKKDIRLIKRTIVEPVFFLLKREKKRNGVRVTPYFRNFKELLGDVDNAAQLLHTVVALLDGVLVVRARRRQHVVHALHVLVRPLRVHGPAVLPDGPVHSQQAERRDALLVEDIDLVADGGDGQAGAGGQDGRLGDERVARQRVEHRLRLLLRVLAWHVRCGASHADVAACRGRREKGEGGPR